MTARSRPKPGDIARVDYGEGSAHLLYLGRHPEYGDAIRVMNVDALPASASELKTLLEAGFTVFYPFSLAVRKGLLHVVGRTELAVEVPTTMRRIGATRGGKVLTWVIVENGKARVTETLSPSELELALGGIWNHEFLCTRLRQKWHPREWK